MAYQKQRPFFGRAFFMRWGHFVCVAIIPKGEG